MNIYYDKDNGCLCVADTEDSINAISWALAVCNGLQGLTVNEARTKLGLPPLTLTEPTSASNEVPNE